MPACDIKVGNLEPKLTLAESFLTNKVKNY